MTKYSNIVLKWGVTTDVQLWTVAPTTSSRATIARKNGSIVLLDRAGKEQARWNFFDAWPSKWTGPSLTAKGNDVAIETLELAHEGLVRA